MIPCSPASTETSLPTHTFQVCAHYCARLATSGLFSSKLLDQYARFLFFRCSLRAVRVVDEHVVLNHCISLLMIQQLLIKHLGLIIQLWKIPFVLIRYNKNIPFRQYSKSLRITTIATLLIRAHIYVFFQQSLLPKSLDIFPWVSRVAHFCLTSFCVSSDL